MFTPLVLAGLLLARPGDIDAGRRLFNDPGLGQHGVSCATCHSTVRSETQQGDGLLRAGFSLWGVANRPYWRGDTRRQLHLTLADAVNVCVQLFQGGAPLKGRSQRQLAAYLSNISPKTKKRAPPPSMPRIQTALEADLNYDRPKYRGGDAERGRGLFYRACHACHPHGGQGVAPSIRGASLADVAKAVREGNGLLRGARRVGAWSPAFGTNRLTHRQVADIAAYVVGLARAAPEARPSSP